MNQEKKLNNKAVQIYLILGGLFIAFLVVCNLIAGKFIPVSFFGLLDDPLIISCGVLPYPVTFLITDLLSEFYGKKRTALVVFTGFIASVLIVLLLKVCVDWPQAAFTNVTSEDFSAVFGNSWRVIGASMTAYLAAQFFDVQLYEFWKKLTKGKYLWIRNNGSTIFSQILDTFLVIVVLFYGKNTWGEMFSMMEDGFIFKILCALADTPIIYLSVFLLRRYFKLKPGEEVQF